METEIRNLTEAQKASLAAEYDRILAFCAGESAEYSLSHYRKMRRIIGTRPTPSASIRKKKTRLAAILVAAAMLVALVGCAAVVYREQIGEFFTEIFEDYIKGSFAEENAENNGIINEVYTLTYVSEGYELVDETLDQTITRYVYQNKDMLTIVFEQKSLTSLNYFIDGVDNATTTIYYNKYVIYCSIIDDISYYIWSDGKYALSVYTEEINLNDAEIEKIIDGMQCSENE